MIHTLSQSQDLWFLAEYYYGNASLWDIIYYYNRETIGDDPENLYAGMTITIPELEIGEKLLFATVAETE